VSSHTDNPISEITSILRKADQSCSIHGQLRDKFQLRASILDYGLMIVSTYLIGLTFVEPTIDVRLSLWLEHDSMVAIVSFITFFLSIVQFKNDWKKKTQEHQRSFTEYAQVKAECKAMITANNQTIDNSHLQRIRHNYNSATAVGTHIPEGGFLSGKKQHQIKVFISKHLDANPGSLISLVRLKLFLRDNFGCNFFD
jgi:hypothetical protein